MIMYARIDLIIVCTLKYMLNTANGFLRKPVFNDLKDHKASKEYRMMMNKKPSHSITKSKTVKGEY